MLFACWSDYIVFLFSLGCLKSTTVVLLPCVAIDKELCTLVISLVKFVIVYLTPSFVFRPITQSPAFLLLSPSPSQLFLKPYVCSLMQRDGSLSLVVEIVSALGQVLYHNRHLWVESRSHGETTLKTDLARPTTISEKFDSCGATLESSNGFFHCSLKWNVCHEKLVPTASVCNYFSFTPLSWMLNNNLFYFIFLYETLATSISEHCIGWYFWAVISL